MCSSGNKETSRWVATGGKKIIYWGGLRYKKKSFSLLNCFIIWKWTFTQGVVYIPNTSSTHVITIKQELSAGVIHLIGRCGKN